MLRLPTQWTIATYCGALPSLVSMRPARSIFSNSNEVTTLGSLP